MAKIIKRNIDIILVAGVGLSLLIVAMIGVYQSIPVAPVSYVSAATTGISVSATVQEWLTLAVSTSSVALSPDLVDTSGNTAIGSSSDITIHVGTNDPAGWILSVESAKGKLSTNGYDIDSCDATSSIAAAGDMYGLNATTSVGTVTISDNYDYWGENIVGTASTTDQTFATKTEDNASTTVATIKIMAACDAAQEAGSYTDTLTITAIGTP